MPDQTTIAQAIAWLKKENSIRNCTAPLNPMPTPQRDKDTKKILSVFVPVNSFFYGLMD